MRHHLCKLGKGASWMLAVLTVCGMATSCQDEYKLDDEKPQWLGASIYDDLKARGEFNYYLRLLADPQVNAASDADNNRGLVDILSKTGSKTVFVATDKAWEEFFAKNAQLPESNPWHTATSYENLSESQKKLLIHTSMLNNAIVMENLASDETSKDGNGNIIYPMRGQYMRRFTDVEATDSITFMPGDQLPKSYNWAEQGKKDYWYRFRTENGGKGLYMVNDSTLPMMLHFTGEYLANNNISDEDFSIFMGRDRVTSDVHIYDALLVEKDGVCQNGYINVTEKVLTPITNMAEVLRTSGKTNIFSHMIDRWSIPYYNDGVTRAYKKVMDSKGIQWEDSIFTKRYISARSFGGQELKTDPHGQRYSTEDLALAFDPGWNAFFDSKGNPQLDMAAMFVPTDATLWKYFTKGGG
ncbi:MAG: hypothetical protein HUK02_08225, partial [Bacteroidaceae bacterium]|nr:hypothetical protein [Bacteroidaceae bacterium]